MDALPHKERTALDTAAELHDYVQAQAREERKVVWKRLAEASRTLDKVIIDRRRHCPHVGPADIQGWLQHFSTAAVSSRLIRMRWSWTEYGDVVTVWFYSQ